MNQYKKKAEKRKLNDSKGQSNISNFFGKSSEIEKQQGSIAPENQISPNTIEEVSFEKVVDASVDINNNKKRSYKKPKKGDSSGHKSSWLDIFDGLIYQKDVGYFCSICQEFSKTKEGPYISEAAQSYRIDKIRKHFGGNLKPGQKGATAKDFFPAMSNIHFYSLKAKRESETNEKIEEMSSSTEQTLRMGKSDQVLEAYFRTLYLCAKQNIPPNDGLESLLKLQK